MILYDSKIVIDFEVFAQTCKDFIEFESFLISSNLKSWLYTYLPTLKNRADVKFLSNFSQCSYVS